MVSNWKTIAEIRREYGQLHLDEAALPASPFDQFHVWFNEIVKIEKSDPTAMVLSTVDEKGFPDSRVVLFKEIKANSIVFFTNYESKKAMQMAAHPLVALNFYWPEMARQVRIRGKVAYINEKESDQYFSSRPILSQYSAMISSQSRIVNNRQELEQKLLKVAKEYQNAAPPRPSYWGGYEVTPFEFEFWQGRDNRLHDRIQYCYDNHKWSYYRLAP